MKYIKIFLFAVLVAILVIFAIKNQGPVDVVVGFETTYEKTPDVVPGEAKEETAPAEEEVVDTETGEEIATVTGDETTPVTGEETAPATEVETAPVAEKETAPAVKPEPKKIFKTIGYEKVFQLPLFLILYVEAFVLILLMSLVGIFEDVALRGRIRELNKENKKLKSEVNILREPKEEEEKPKGKKGRETAKAKRPEVVPEEETKKAVVPKKELKEKKPGIIDRIKKGISGDSKAKGSKGPGKDIGL